MSESISEKRIKKLSSKLGDKSFAALITSETNIRYFTEFANSEGVLLVSKDKSVLFVDFRYGEAAVKLVKSCEVVVYKSLSESLKDYAKSLGLTQVFVESGSITVQRANSFSRIFRECGCKLVTNDTLDKLITNIRIIKSADEIEKIAMAQKITEEAYLDLLNMVKPGITEAQLAFELEFLMRKKGASGVSFDLITIAGKKTSMPHGVPDGSIVQRGDFVTFDIGAIFEGYHSDMTRTVAVGEVSDEKREIYDIVLKAQLAGLAKVKAGVKASEVDFESRQIIQESGYGEQFRHSTGHGVGLEIHEQPNVSPKSQTILSENMIITVEPGIYIPDKFGVRIEDMVAVTKSGYRNFASLPKSLIVI